MTRTPQEWFQVLKDLNAVWIFSCDYRRPHAVLREGGHSNGLVNCRLLIPHDQLMADVASDLVNLLIEARCPIEEVGGVVGPKNGATKLAKLISEDIARRTLQPCVTASPSKSGEDSKGPMIFTTEEIALIKGKQLLLCDDVGTTLGSVGRVKAAVEAEEIGASVMPWTPLIFNRSELHEANGCALVPLIQHYLPVWNVHRGEKCELCERGSKAIPGKDGWDALNALPN
jgi:orotate phosphoribosyltransferase